MKNIYTVMGIIAAASLLSTFVASNAFAMHTGLTQTSIQGSFQGSSQSQHGIISFSPQTTGQGTFQTNLQAGCTALANIICG